MEKVLEEAEGVALGWARVSFLCQGWEEGVR